ncbi:hypothetical protein [Halococcus saccharolyticus]|uniref:Uncharacterized protein n=1 Tax=Halococcus saccharolyticus DSM 5350 TaxID=1227455 RepID=M0ME30_9EURY|nr:hypothetical protein [Halococcus saccharolyticus]EMA42670.1 hypothetical protein C449_16048 [Halococcus saccharolyticus DSM 5350]
MIDLRLAVKALGIVAGFLLIGYGFAIRGAPRYDTVSDRYASAISSVGLILVLVATGGFFAGTRLSLALEGGGYLTGLIGGTWAFRRIANHQKRYEEA